MNIKFEPNNLRIKNSGNKNENIFTNRLKGVNLQSLVSEYKYFTPQFYLQNKRNIKSFHNIDLNLKLFNKKYDELKNILELNKPYLKLPITNLKLNFDTKTNIIYNNLEFKKASDFNYLISNKTIFKNLKEYRISQNIYDKLKSNIFVSILNEKLKKKDKLIFIQMYKNMNKYSKNILKYDFSNGVMGYSPLFNLNEPVDNNLINNNNTTKYKLMNSKIKHNNQKKNLETKINLNEKKKKISDLLINYTTLYNSYNYNKLIIEKTKEIEEYCIKFHNISLKLSQKSYTNIFDLLNLLLDQEYYLVNFILNFNDIESYKKALKQDNIVRKYIKRNIMNFSSYMDEYKVKAPKIGKTDMFSIQDYDVNRFFESNK